MKKPDLLLLHGALGSQEQWQPFEPLLREHFSLHLLDFEGHGERSLGPEGFRLDTFVQNVCELQDERQLGPLNIFGYSMGGYVAMVLALLEAERVRRICTLGTKLQWSPEIAAREIRGLDPDKIQAKVPRFAEQLQSRHTAHGWRNVLSGTAALMTDLGRDDRLHPDRCSSIGQPLRLGLGDRDTMVTMEETLAVYRAVPGAEMQVFPATPHPLEGLAPARLSFALRDFFLHENV